MTQGEKKQDELDETARAFFEDTGAPEVLTDGEPQIKEDNHNTIAYHRQALMNVLPRMSKALSGGGLGARKRQIMEPIGYEFKEVDALELAQSDLQTALSDLEDVRNPHLDALIDKIQLAFYTLQQPDGLQPTTHTEVIDMYLDYVNPTRKKKHHHVHEIIYNAGRLLTIIQDENKTLHINFPKELIEKALKAYAKFMDTPFFGPISPTEVKKIFDIVKDALIEEGRDSADILARLRSHRLPAGRVAYFIFEDFFESAKEKFLASAEGEAALRAASTQLKQAETPKPSDKETTEAIIRDNKEIINRDILTRMGKFIESEKFDTTVKEIILAERITEGVATQISLEIRNENDKFVTYPDLPRLMILEASPAITSAVLALKIQGLSYEIKVGLMTEKELETKKIELESLKKENEGNAAAEVSQGLRIIKQTMIRVYEEMERSKGATALSAELCSRDELEEACRLLGDTDFGQEFTSDAMGRELPDAKYILRSMEEHLRRTEFQPFNLYEWHAAHPTSDEDTYPAEDPSHPLHDAKLANIDLFSPPMTQHLACFAQIVINYLARLANTLQKHTTNIT